MPDIVPIREAREIVVVFVEMMRASEFKHPHVLSHMVYRGTEKDRAWYIAQFCGGLIYDTEQGITYNARCAVEMFDNRKGEW